MKEVWKGLSVFMQVVVIVMVLLAILGVSAWVYNWLVVPGRVTSSENVRDQWQFAYDTEEDLKAAARQVCNARRSLVQVSDDAKDQWIAHVTAREDNYARIASDYDSRMRDAFRASLVAPPDVRRRSLSLDEMIETLGLECD